MDLVIVDLNALFYNTVTAYEKLPPCYTLQSVNELTLLQVISGAFLGDLPVKQFQVIFLLDKKPYWRSNLLSELGVNYKGKRQRNPLYDVQINELRGYTHEILIEHNLTAIDLYASTLVKGKRVGYEADDLCAGIVRKFAHQYNKVYLLTVDSDWMPFTEIDNVVWLGITNWKPRVRNASIALEWCKNHKQLNSTILRKQFKWETISDLWRHKARFGDVSDNIRGNLKDQSPRKYDCYVDLMNPHEDFMCWEEDGFDDLFYRNLTSPLNKMDSQLFLDYAYGVPTTITNFVNQMVLVNY